MAYYVYILSNADGNALEVGVGVDLKRIVDEKREYLQAHPEIKKRPSNLVFYYPFEAEADAREFEAEINGQSWLRQTRYINHNNPEWHDLYYNIIER